MAKKSNFIKNLLTTASAVAVLAGSVDAMAAVPGDGASRPLNNTPTINNAALHFHNEAAGAPAAFTDTNQIINAVVGANSGATYTNDTNAVDIHGFNLYGNNAHFIAAVTGSKLGAVGNIITAAAITEATAVNAANAGAGVVATPKLTLQVNDAVALTLTGRTTALTTANSAIGVDVYTGLDAVTLNGPTAKIIVNSNSGGALTFDNTFDGNVAGNGLIEVTTEAIFNGAIGATSLANIKITAGVDTTFNANASATSFSLTDVNSNIVIDNGATLTGAIDGTVADKGTIEFTGNTGGGKIVGDIGSKFAIDSITVHDKTAEIVGNITTANGIHFGGAASTLKMTGDDKIIIGGIIANNPNEGIVDITANTTVKGEIGGNGAEIATLKLSTEGKKLTVDSNGAAGSIAANAIAFDADATLVLTGAGQDFVVEGPMTVGLANAGLAGGVGTVEISNTITNVNTVTFKGVIGDKASEIKSLKLLKHTGDANIEFNTATDVHIQSLELDGNANIKLNKAAGEYRFGGITVAKIGNNTLEVAEDLTLVGAANGAEVNFGSATSTLASLKISGDKTLTVGDGINIYAAKLDTTGAGEGTIDFGGSSILAAVQDANSLKNINANGAADKTLKLKGVLELAANGVNTGILNIGAGTVTLDSDLKAVGIQAAVPGKGTLELVNAGAVTITAPITNVLGEIKFSGSGNVSFTGAVADNNNFNFTGTNATIVEVDNKTNLGNIAVLNTSSQTQTVVINKDTTFTKAIGDAAHGVKVNTQGFNAIAQVGTVATDLVGATFITNAANTGSLEIITADTVVGGVGDATKSLNNLEFTESGTILGNAYSKTANVPAGKTATFGGKIKGVSLTLDGAASNAIFNNGASLETVIGTKFDKNGAAIFKGDTTISNEIGTKIAKLAEVTFEGGTAAVAANIKLANNIHATNIKFIPTVAGGRQQISLTTPVELEGATTFKNSNIMLDDKVLTATSGLTLEGDVAITTSITQGSTLSGGAIVSKGAISTANLNTLTLKFDGTIMPKTGAMTFTLLDNSAGTGTEFDLTKIKYYKEEGVIPLIKWDTISDNKSSLFLTAENNIVNGIAARFADANTVMTAADIANVKSLENNSGGDAAQWANALNNMNSKKTAESFQRLIANEVSQELGNVISDTSASVASRMFVNSPGTLGQSIETASNGDAYTGVAAGDETSRYGVWANPFFGNGTQKARKGSVGYKSERYGVSIGFDTKANDNMLVGAAVTYLNSSIKHKNQKSGDTTKADSVLFSIYGMQQLTDNWFAQGIATFGSNKVKSNEGRVISNTVTQRAIGNYTSMSFGGELMAGYNYFADQYTLTPMGGLRYTRVNNGGYKETGTDFLNLDVTNKASDKIEVVLGARAAVRAFDLGTLSITPEMHAFVNHDLVGKKASIEARLNGLGAVAINKAKPARTNYTLGAGVSTNYGMMNYGISYDANIANKYVGHQGSVKVRVNF